MSNTDDFAEQKIIEQEEVQTQSLMVKPLHRQFTVKLVAILLIIVITITLIFTLFYQQSEQSRLLIDSELKPLKQKLEQLQTLQKAEYIVDKLLFSESGLNFVELHTQLLGVNRQLLQLESSNTYLYQKWLNINELVKDLALRIQQNHGRNEQLKQSSIIQLQLIRFSFIPIINKKIAQQTILLKQLQADQINDRLTLNRTNAYISSTRQLHDLQQLKNLFSELLPRFETLTIHTSLEGFDLLRIGVKKIIAQRDALKTDDKTTFMVDFNLQIDAFEKIVVTQQSALAKWQGYIRLAQEYQQKLEAQKNDLVQLLSGTQAKITPHVSGRFDDWLDEINIKFKINLTQKELTLTLLLAISLSLLIFCYLLWSLREKIKTTTQESLALIQKSLSSENSGNLQANCVETQEIIQQLQSIAIPVHNDQAFQELAQECRVHQEVVDKQAQTIAAYTHSINQQQVKTTEQITLYLNRELKKYNYLEYKVLLLLQQQQAKLKNKSIIDQGGKGIQLSSLFSIYQKLGQFCLASELQSENTRLTLVDVNLVDHIHAILINAQVEQQKFNNQLYFSYDEQLLINAKFDFYLFEQLMYLLIEITLQDYQDTQLHLHLKLKDKSIGQQLVQFVVTVKTEAIDTFPDFITLLISSKANFSKKRPLIDMFNIFITKQYGENIMAQLIEGGFQLSFELPLALVSVPVFKKQQVSKLEGINVILLSHNEVLSKLLGEFIHSTWAQFKVLDHIDMFNQQFTEAYLSKHKVDVLIVASDIAQKNIDLVTQQLNRLSDFLKPKLVVLQSGKLNFDDFGFYSQSEQLLFKDVFLQNIKNLLVSEEDTNQLLLPEQCHKSHCLVNELFVMLAVNSPQKHQNFQRLLCMLGFKVHVVSHVESQTKSWKTGVYCILFTEFPTAALLKMTNKPLVDVAVFSLTDKEPKIGNNTYFDDWHISQLVTQPTLTELSDILSPWLQCNDASSSSENIILTPPDKLVECVDKEVSIKSEEEIHEEFTIDNDELVITELVESLSETHKETVFDFSQYLHHQGSVELALFMLDDYAQDNHQKLDILVNAIKGKDFDQAKEAVIDLQLNANILAASELAQLCSQWLKLLNGNNIPSSLKEVNILLKETRAELKAIDEYTESI
jgi:hypothetical protein